MKINLKSMIPSKFKAYIIYLLGLTVGIRYYLLDKKRFKKSAFLLNKSPNKDKLEAKILFYTHAIEKGLTNINLRLGFGKNAYSKLILCLTEFKNYKYVNSTVYNTAVSTLNSYIKLHKENDYNVDSLIKLVSAIEPSYYLYNSGGYRFLKRNDVLMHSLMKDANFFTSRHSVRNFSSEPVQINSLIAALKIAQNTPSVCNRQSWKIYLIKTKTLMDEILLLQGGINNFGQNADSLIMVTSNNHFLANYSERNQGHIDSGMFSMSILYALHSQGIATCPLNANTSIKTDKLLRKKLSIPRNENITMFILIGNYPEEFKVAYSQRLPIEEKLIIL